MDKSTTSLKIIVLINKLRFSLNKNDVVTYETSNACFEKVIFRFLVLGFFRASAGIILIFIGHPASKRYS